MWIIYPLLVAARVFAIACIVLGMLALAVGAIAGVIMIGASVHSAIFLRRRKWWER